VRELAAEQAAKGVKQLDRDDVDQGVKLLKTDALCFNDLLGGVPNEPFHLSTPLEPTLTVQAAWTLSLRMENNPCAGLAHFLTVMAGYAYIVVLDVEELIAAGGTMDTISQFLDNADAPHFFKKAPTFSVPQGKSIFVPFGMIPLVVGVGSKNGEECMHLSYVSYYVMDTRRASASSGQLKAEVAAYITRSSSRRTKIWHDKQLSAIKAFGEKVWGDLATSPAFPSASSTGPAESSESTKVRTEDVPRPTE
jgi:hypothetical protein